MSCLNTVNTRSNALQGRHKLINGVRRVWHMVAVGMGVVLTQPVCAVTKLNQTFTPYVGSSHSYDTNLLRASDKNNDPKNGKTVTDSFIHQIRAGLNVDWRKSRQQLIVNAQVNQNWYTAFSQLDYFGHDVLAQWNWVASNKVKGEIGYRHDETLSSFAQLGQGQPESVTLNNFQTSQGYFANGEYQILPSIYLKAGYVRGQWEYGAGRINSNQIQNTGEFSAQYRNLSRTMIGLRFVVTDGQYQRPLDRKNNNDTGFLRTSYNLDGEWKYSDKLRVKGSVGYLQQDYDNLNGSLFNGKRSANLNFSDVIARFELNWLPSEKTTLAFSAWRDVDQAFTLNATFVLTQGVRLTPAWVPTAKIRVEMPLSYENQSYLGGSASSNQIATLQRIDDVVDLGLNVIYTPWINTELAFNVKHESRDSNFDNTTTKNFFSYDAQMVGISAKVEF
jgi:hypothetical protein